MSIEIDMTFDHPTQEQFGSVAYEVVGLAYEIHKQMGGVFRERTYHATLRSALGTRAISELEVRLIHQDFVKPFYLDLVVDRGCLFELKATTEIHDRHRAQLIQ